MVSINYNRKEEKMSILNLFGKLKDAVSKNKKPSKDTSSHVIPPPKTSELRGRGIAVLMGSKPICATVREENDKLPEEHRLSGQKLANAIRHRCRLANPSAHPATKSKTKKGAIHHVNPPGMGKKYQVALV
jgi:hypothetical protein